MFKYYTRPCNFFYGNYANKLIRKKKAFPLNGNNNIAFNQLEILIRKKNKATESKYYSIFDLKKLNKDTASVVQRDLKNIISLRKNIRGLKFNNPNIIGVLNITPDSFSDGGLFFDDLKAYEQADFMIKSGAKIIDIGGESTRPGSKIVNEREEWDRIKNTITKIKKKYPKIILSLDTRNSSTMEFGIVSGVKIINDVSGFTNDNKSLDVVKIDNINFNSNEEDRYQLVVISDEFGKKLQFR